MDPPSLQRRYELVSGGAATRALKYALRRYLNMTWDDFKSLPWHEQGWIIEGLHRDELYNPNDYLGGDVDEDLDSLAGYGYHVEVEHQ